jgi:hypothetical protein
LSYPFAALAEEIRALGFERGVIVTEDVLMAGNLRHQFLDSTVVVPGINERDMALDAADRDLAVVWNATERDDVPESLADFANCKLRPAVRCPNIDYRDIPYDYSAGRTAKAAMIVVPGRR